MYIRNMKYVKGNPPVDNWEEIPDKSGEAMISYFERYAKEKGFNVSTYMEFIRKNVVRKVS